MRIPDDSYLSNLDASGGDIEMTEDALKISALQELGVTGLKRTGGYIDEEFLPQLRGRKAISVYKEMGENDPTVGAVLFTIKRLMRNIEWRVEPGGKSREDSKCAKHIESCMEDMSTSWDDFITEALSMLQYGWSWHEVVYKRRGGLWTKNEHTRSKFSDDLIGWRKFPIRAQETLLRWVFDESGDTRAMVQLAPPRYQTVAIPIERSMLFRFEHQKGNPEGFSMLRNAYRPWFMKKRLEEFEAIGVERDLAGLPIVKLPAEMLRAKRGTEQFAAVEQFRKMVKTVRRNEQEGIVFPNAYDQDSKQPLYTFELMGGGGARAFNTDAIIRRYEERILQTVLADFIMVGHQASGSYSLHTDKTGIFRTTLNSIAGIIADVINRHAIPRLLVANGWRPENLPTIVPSDVDSPDIAQLAQFMSALSGTGVTWFPDPVLENFVRDAARLPKLDEDAEERRRQLQMRTEATQLAQTTSEYLMAQQQSEMAMMSPQEQAVVEGESAALHETAHSELSGQGELQEQEMTQNAMLQQQQRADQQQQSATEAKFKERDYDLRDKEMRSKEKLTLAQVKAKQQAERAKSKESKSKQSATQKGK